MKRILALTLCLISILSMLVMAGCTEKEENDAPRTVVDMQGNTVTLPAQVTKYCTVYSTAVPMIAMLDQNMEHCVMYPKSGWFEYWEFEMHEGLADHAMQVNKREVTAEQIVESGTEVFFWSSASHQELVTTLTEMGIACVNVQITTADDFMKALEIIEAVFDTDYAHAQMEKYKKTFEEYRAYTQKQVEKIPEEVKKSVLVIGNVDSLVGYGDHTYTGDWTKFVGLKNISPSDDGADKVNLTMEQIYEFDPDIVIANGIFDVETIYADPAWSVMRATQNGMLLSNPSVFDFWSMPTVESPLQFLWALNKFYPEYAGELNPVDETIAFYKEFYGYDMARADAEAIVAGEHFLMS